MRDKQVCKAQAPAENRASIFTICACMDTSSALIGSSQITRSGRRISTRGRCRRAAVGHRKTRARNGWHARGIKPTFSSMSKIISSASLRGFGSGVVRLEGFVAMMSRTVIRALSAAYGILKDHLHLCGASATWRLLAASRVISCPSSSILPAVGS